MRPPERCGRPVADSWISQPELIFVSVAAPERRGRATFRTRPSRTAAARASCRPPRARSPPRSRPPPSPALRMRAPDAGTTSAGRRRRVVCWRVRRVRGGATAGRVRPASSAIALTMRSSSLASGSSHVAGVARRVRNSSSSDRSCGVSESTGSPDRYAIRSSSLALTSVPLWLHTVATSFRFIRADAPASPPGACGL